MRTTLTIDDDILHKLKMVSSKQGKAFKEVVNETLRKGLDRTEGRSKRRKLKLTTHNLSYKRGVDEAKIKELLDEIDTSEGTKS